jgi:hypothetical protein
MRARPARQSLAAAVFDPVSEWTSFRSLSLLEQFPPCTVLIILEVAREGLLELEAGK